MQKTTTNKIDRVPDAEKLKSFSRKSTSELSPSDLLFMEARIVFCQRWEEAEKSGNDGEEALLKALFSQHILPHIENVEVAMLIRERSKEERGKIVQVLEKKLEHYISCGSYAIPFPVFFAGDIRNLLSDMVLNEKDQ